MSKRTRSRSESPHSAATGGDERFLQQLLTLSPVAIYSLRPEEPYGAIFISASITKLTGHRPEDFLEDPRFGERHIHPQDVAAYRGAFAQAVRDGTAVMECRMRRHDGTYGWYRHEVRLVRDDDGAPVEIVGCQVDITAEKEASDRLRRSEERFWDYTEASSDWLWEMDADLRFSFISGRARAPLPNGGMLGRTREENAAEDTTTAKWQAYRETLRQRRPLYDFEYAIRRNDGGIAHIRISGRPVYAPDGTFTGYRGVAADVTALRRREEEARRREQMLLRAEQIARMGNWRWPVGGEGVEWSDGMYAIARLERPAVVPRLAEQLDRIHVDDRRAVLQAMGRIIAARSQGTVEYRVTAYDGTERVFWTDGRCELDERGEVVALLGVCQDITNRRRVENELRLAKEQAEAANRIKADFLASISHELRTPLNAIIGFSEVMAAETLGPLGSSHYVEYSHDIHRSGLHLLHLINGLLDTAKIEAGKMTLREDTVDLDAVIDEALRLARVAAANPRHLFKVELPSPSVRLRADPRALSQILLNLVSNAIKFTPEDGTIRVGAATGADHVEIVVEDTGVGIPEDRLGDLGQAFIQIENVFSRKHAGSGMGLFISRSLAELHGGTLQIESSPGVGTRVTVRLPRERLIG